MKYACVTTGEKLAYFVERDVLVNIPWDKVAFSLLCTGRGDALCSFFREIAVVNLTCRIVTAGTSLLKESPSRPARSLRDSGFENEFHDFIRERLYIRPPLSKDLLRNALRAVESARQDVTPTKRKAFKSWAQRQHTFCYMCGVSLDFTEEHKYHKFSLDHIWPQRYGGDSDEDNWLPACGSCNSHKKHDFATWAMAGIQSVVLGFTPTENEYTMVDGTHRFAMHYLAAKRIAIQRDISLKDAFRILGPWELSPRLMDESDIGDFFNLANHRATLEIG
jgi:hypothetical protein